MSRCIEYIYEPNSLNDLDFGTEGVVFISYLQRCAEPKLLALALSFFFFP